MIVFGSHMKRNVRMRPNRTTKKKNVYWKIWMRKLIETHPAIHIRDQFLLHYCFIVWCLRWPFALDANKNQHTQIKFQHDAPPMPQRCGVRVCVKRLPAQMFMLWNWRVQDRKETSATEETEQGKSLLLCVAVDRCDGDEERWRKALYARSSVFFWFTRILSIIYLCAQWKWMSAATECDAPMDVSNDGARITSCEPQYVRTKEVHPKNGQRKILYH